jgi:hypothetical protein
MRIFAKTSVPLILITSGRVSSSAPVEDLRSELIASLLPCRYSSGIMIVNEVRIPRDMTYYIVCRPGVIYRLLRVVNPTLHTAMSAPSCFELAE